MFSTTVEPPRPRRAQGLAAWLLAVCLVGAAPGAFAQSDKAAAESLFQTGKALMAEGKLAEACPKFVESQRLDVSVGTLLNLGKCYEDLGRTASAWAEYKNAATLARSTRDTTREAAAQELAAALEPRLSKLRIDAVSKDTPGLVIKKDGVEVGLAMLGTTIAVDPGPHTIEASAPGYELSSTTVDIGKDGDSKSITIPALARAEGASSSPTPGASNESAADGAGGGSDPLLTAGCVVGAAGLVGIGIGAVLGLMASSQASNTDDDPSLCPDKQCTPAGRAEIDAATSKALGSTIGFSVGGVALAAGVVLVVLSATSATEPAESTTASPWGRAFSSVLVAPSLGADGAGLIVAGRF